MFNGGVGFVDAGDEPFAGFGQFEDGAVFVDFDAFFKVGMDLHVLLLGFVDHPVEPLVLKLVGAAFKTEGLLKDDAVVHGAAIAPNALDDRVDTLLFVVTDSIADGFFAGIVGDLVAAEVDATDIFLFPGRGFGGDGGFWSWGWWGLGCWGGGGRGLGEGWGGWGDRSGGNLRVEAGLGGVGKVGLGLGPEAVEVAEVDEPPVTASGDQQEER